MRIILTGGTGLIGKALAIDFIKQQHEVFVLSRDPERRPGQLPAGVKLVKWDGRSVEGWGHLVDGAEAIVNLAGESIAAGRWTDERKQRILNSRLNAGLAVVQAVEQASQKPNVVIQSSAVGYYGPSGDQDITEGTPPGKDFVSQVCVRWEGSTTNLEKMGVRRAIIRTGIVLDAHEGALVPMLLPFRLFTGGSLGNGRQWFPWIHLADEVSAIRFLIEHPEGSGPFNLAAPDPLTNAQFSRMLGKVLRRPALIPVPAFVLRLLFGEMATVLVDGQKVLPSHLENLGYQFRFPHIEPALRNILNKEG